MHFVSEFIDQSKHAITNNEDRDIILKYLFLFFDEVCALSKYNPLAAKRAGKTPFWLFLYLQFLVLCLGYSEGLFIRGLIFSVRNLKKKKKVHIRQAINRKKNMPYPVS